MSDIEDEEGVDEPVLSEEEQEEEEETEEVNLISNLKLIFQLRSKTFTTCAWCVCVHSLSS